MTILILLARMRVLVSAVSFSSSTNTVHADEMDGEYKVKQESGRKISDMYDGASPLILAQ
jgi:hypothetical protein